MIKPTKKTNFIIGVSLTICVLALLYIVTTTANNMGNPDNYKAVKLKYMDKTVKDYTGGGKRYYVMYEDKTNKTYWEQEITSWDYNNTEYTDLEVPLRADVSIAYMQSMYLDNTWIDLYEVDYTK